MTLAGVNVRRTLQLLLAVVLLFGATSVIASQRADAAYPGGNEWIVFQDNFDLWAIKTDGTGLTNLTDSVGSLEADPAFSADGTKLAYAMDPGVGESRIYVATFNPSGPSLGTPVQVSAGPIDGVPTWSPDGTTVAYQRKLPPVTGTADADDATGVTLTDAGVDFVTLQVASGDIVTNGRTGATGVVGTVDDANTITLSSALSGGTPEDGWLTNDAYTISRVNRQIYKSAITGSDLTGTRLSASGSILTHTDEAPVWSPDGTKIAFVSDELESNPNVMVMSATDGSGRTNVTTDGAGFDNVVGAPAWAPDGSRIAFTTPKDAGYVNTGVSNIWTISSTGTGAQAIVVSTDGDLAPAWSPDGELIGFQKTDTGGDKLYVVASDGSSSPVRVGSAATPATNAAPDWQPVLTGVNDAAAVDEDGSVNINVLANDLVLASAVGTPTTSATLVTAPTKGTAVRQGDGSFTYTHTGPEIGTSSTTDTFEYTVTQGSATSTAVVTVTINPVDNAPTAVADEYDVSHGATLNISAPGVLDNDTDPEGGGLTAVKVSDPTHGTLTLNPNGSFSYTNDGASSAALTDSFTYKANDGTNDSNTVTVTLNVGPENPDPPSVTVGGPSFGAPGLEATFSSTVTAGSGPKVYSWTVTTGGSTVGTGTAATLDFTPAAAGAYTVELTVTDDAGTDSDSVAFTVMGDISSSVFVSDIVWLANEGITKGCNPPTNDEYCPNNNVTRGQMAAFLVRFLGLTDIDPAISFDDASGSIFEQDILKLATAGITKGCNPAEGNTNFCPNASVTRGQMAAFLVRALKLTDNGGGDLFVDDDASIFEGDIDRLATAGITKGCNPPANTQFCPSGTVTRGQMAAFLHRADSLR